MTMRNLRWMTVLAGLAGTLALVGCGSSVSSPGIVADPIPSGNYTGSAFTGKVMVGTTPVVGAAVEFYVAGTTGNGSAPSLLLSSALSTDATGGFSVGSYSCPAASSVVYLVATGGKVGSNAANAALVLMTVPGACNSIAAGSSYVLDEATTVASAFSLAQFLKPGAQLGATSGNLSGLTLAAGTAANLVNLATGTAPGAAFPTTGTAPSARLNSLADAINACAASSASSSSACAQLLAAATISGAVPATTLDAALQLAQHPASNVVAVFTLSQSSSAYQPALAAAPADWTLFATYSGGGLNAPTALGVDSKGRVWVASYYSTASLFTNTGAPVLPSGVTGNSLYENYGAAVDANDNFWLTDEESSYSLNSGDGAVTELNSQGVAVSGSPYASGGIYFPYAMAFDATNVAWLADYGNSHVVQLNSSGTPLSGSSGYSGIINNTSTLAFPVAIAVDANRNGWLANYSNGTVTKISADGSSSVAYSCCDGPDGIAVDASGNVWVANYYTDSVSLLSNAGTVVSSGITGGGVLHPQGIAVDGAGNVWVANYRGPSLAELAGAGSSSPLGTVLSPNAGWGPDAKLVEAFALAIDGAGNLWVTNFGSNTLTEFIGLAAPVKTPLLGPVRTP